MGKRSSFERVERDFYRTPREAVLPLLPHLAPGTTFIEPCVGNGALVGHLSAAGMVLDHAGDIMVIPHYAFEMDARTTRYRLQYPGSIFITNPPWLRETLHPLIVNLSDQAPTWLLFDADWQHTRQSAPFLPRLRRIVSVGRVKWIPDSKMTGKDNCAWHLFDKPSEQAAEFYGRLAA